jgi:rare lipoprotein A
MVKRFLPLFICLLILSACESKKTSSTLYPDISKPTSRPWQKPYTVNGQRYEPLDTHYGFVQTGVASWYGSDFHGKNTSNGERYDMYAMTAAHKTLPLGVYVRVRNMDNGRETVVRVNDRGPFVKGRIIDLSYAAAKQIGVDIIGTATVRIEALGYRETGTDQYTALVNYDAGDYTVQVGSFKEYNNAQRLSEEMKRRYGFSEIHMTNVNGDTFYRVYAGKYSTLGVAERAEKEFSEHGYPGSFTVALE